MRPPCTYTQTGVAFAFTCPAWRERTVIADKARRVKTAWMSCSAHRPLPITDPARLEGEQGPVRLVDVFGGKSQLIVHNHMWFPGEQWQCPGCTGFTSQFTRLEFLDSYDARFVIVTQGPIDEALTYKRRVGNKMTWYSTANSPFGSDIGAPPGGGFAERASSRRYARGRPQRAGMPPALRRMGRSVGALA